MSLYFDVVEASAKLGPTLHIYNGDGKTSFAATSTAGDGNTILYDRKGQPEVTLGGGVEAAGGSPDGVVGVYRNGQAAGMFQASAQGGVLSVGAPDGSNWTAQMAGPVGGGLFRVWGKDGTVHAAIGVHSAGGGFVQVANSAGKPAAAMGVLHDSGYMSTFDSNDKLLFATPLATATASAPPAGGG